MEESDFGMIREATLDDVPALVEIGREFYDLTKIGDIEFCEDSVGTMIQTLITGELSTVFVNEELTATIGGMLYPFWVNTAYLAGNELFWWVSEQGRGGSAGRELWTTLEKWAKTEGCTLFQMMCLEGFEPSRISKMYQRRGYVPLEHVFTKVL